MTRRLSAPPSRARRAVRTVALVSAAGTVLAGCQWTSPVQTDMAYEPADGRSAALGGVNVNNIVLVAEKKGGPGTLVGLGVNNTDQPVSVAIGIAGQQAAQVMIEPRSSAQLSDPKSGEFSTLPQVPVAPGGLVDVTVMAQGIGSKTLSVPVLAPNPPYEAYGKGAEQTPSPTSPAETASPTESGSPAPTGSPSESPTEAPMETPTSTSTGG